jgi:hypothetical protein
MAGGTPQSKRQAQVMLGGQMITPYEVATGRSPSPPPPPSSEEEVEELPPLGEEPIEAHVRLLRDAGRATTRPTGETPASLTGCSAA